LFNELGAILVLSGRQLDQLKTVSSECRSASYIAADLSNDKEVESLVKGAVEKNGRIDILVIEYANLLNF
jgi:NADP-dependent 3-hydroxy acid dehydrogenase YdfG